MALDLGQLVARLGVDSTQLDRGLDSVPGKMREAGAKSGDKFGTALGSKLGEAGAAAGDNLKEKITGALGAAALGGALGAALIEGMGREASSDKLAAQLGLGEAENAKFGRIAGQVYAGAYGDSLEQVNDAIRGITLNVGEGNADWLKSTTQTVLDLSATFDAEAGAISRSVGQMLSTGMAENSAQALDIITRGFQVGADRGEDFLDVLSEYSSTFQGLGLDGAAATGLINQALAAGIPNADFAADAIREMNIIISEGSEESAAALGDLGLNAEGIRAGFANGGAGAAAAMDQVMDALRNTEDPLERNRLATELVGTQYEDLGDALLAMDPSEAVASLGKVDGAAADMGKTLADNASTNLESFKRQVTNTFVDVVGGKALPAINDAAAALATGLSPAVDALAPVLSTAGSAAADLGAAIPTPILQGAAIAVGALALVLGTQAAVTATASAVTGAYTAVKGIFVTTTNAETGAVTLSTVARVANTIQTGAATVATSAWTAAQWLLNTALSANPLALVAIAVAALVAGVVIAYRESETFRNIITGAFDAIQTAASFMWDNVLKPVFRLWLDTWFTVIDAIVSGAAKAFGWVPGIGDKLKTANREFDSFRDGVNASLDGVKDKTASVTVTGKINFSSAAASANPSPNTAADHFMGGVIDALAGGGKLSGPGSGLSDSIMAVDPAGRHVANVATGEWVINAQSSRKHDRLLRAINDDRVGAPGYAGGGVLVNARGDGSAIASGVPRFMAAAEADAIARATPIFQAEADKQARARSGPAGTAMGREDILAFIRSTDPLPYIWGATGPNGYDCSGLVGAVLNRMIGRSPNARAFTTVSISAGQYGLKTGLGGTLSIGVTPGSGHMAGEYGGLPFEAESTKTGIKIGGAATPVTSFARKFHLAMGGMIEDQINKLGEYRAVAGDPSGVTLDDRTTRRMFPASMPWNIYDTGGWLQPGAAALNRGSRPEAVLTPDESAGLKAMLAGRVGAPVMGGVNYNGPVYVVDPESFARETVARQRDAARVAGLPQLAATP